MAMVLPLACGGRLAGSAAVVAQEKGRVFLATALHLLGTSDEVQIAIPPHGGDITVPQVYPLTQAPIAAARVVTTDPFCDLAILEIQGSLGMPVPPICTDQNLPAVGTEVVVLGYPFAPIGSMLETWTPGHVTARARQQIIEGVLVDEIVLSVTAHPGASGSAVVGRKDGVLYGILRGALAPPEVMKIGNLPVATDTTVTFATCAAYIPPLLQFAKEH